MKRPYLILFFLMAGVFASSCKKDTPDYSEYLRTGGKLPVTGTGGTGGTGGSGGSSTTTGEYYFKGTIDSKTVNWQVTNEDAWAAGVASSGSVDKDNGDYAFAGSIGKLVSISNVQPYVAIYFKTVHFVGFDGRDAVFRGFVPTGALPYSASETVATDDKEKSVFIWYTDEKGVEYRSSLGSQTGSTFNVVSKTIIPAELGISEKIKLKVTLSCKLYPLSGTGTPVTFTNCEATIYLQRV